MASLTLVSLLLIGTPLFAQRPAGGPNGNQPPNDSSSTDSRFSEVPLEFSAGPEHFRLYRPKSSSEEDPTGGAPYLRIELAGSKDGSTGPLAARVDLPEWLREHPVEVSLQSASIATDRVAVIVTVSPATGGAAARRLQIAHDFAASRPTDWRHIDTTEASQLDVGRSLSLKRPATGETDAPAKLIRHNSRLEEMFCGINKHPTLGQQKWLPDQGKFESHETRSLTEAARHIAAVVPQNSLAGPFTSGVYQWFWTGNLAESSPQRRRFRPTMLGDRKPSTYWEVTPWIRRSDGSLKGAAFASARLTDAAAVESVRIVPGDADAPDAFQASHKPTALLLVFSGGETLVAELPDISFDALASRGGLIVELPSPIRSHCLTVAPLVEDATTSSVSISEITPVLTIDDDSAEATATRIVDAIVETKRPGRRRELTNLGLSVSPQFTPLVKQRIQELLHKTDKKSKTGAGNKQSVARLVSVLGRLEAQQALPILTDLFVKTRQQPAHTPLRQALRRALAAHGSDAADALVAMLDEKSLDDRSRLMTLRLLDRVALQSHRVALVESLGEGTREIREERIRTVSAAGVPALEPVLTLVSHWPSTEAGHDALRVASRIGRRPEAEPPLDNERPRAIASRLSPSQNRRTLLLALQAAAVIRTDRIVEHARELGEHSHPLVRREAVKALGHYRGETSRRVLAQALSDQSPDVRIAAVNTISTRPDRTQMIDGLMAYAQNETWRTGRTQAVRVLAELETPKTSRFFDELLRPGGKSEQSTALKEIAVSALLRAGRTLEADICLSLLRAESHTSETLRLRSIDLLGLDDSQSGLQALLGLAQGKFGSIPEEAADESHRRALRQRALLSLGRRRSEKARPVLEGLAFGNQPTDVTTRRHAIRALGFYDDKELIPRLRGLLEKADSSLKPAIRQTIAMLENRRTLQDLQKRIDAIRRDQPASPRKDK